MITKKHGTSDDAYSEFYANSHIDGRYSTLLMCDKEVIEV